MACYLVCVENDGNKISLHMFDDRKEAEIFMWRDVIDIHGFGHIMHPNKKNAEKAFKSWERDYEIDKDGFGYTYSTTDEGNCSARIIDDIDVCHHYGKEN